MSLLAIDVGGTRIKHALTDGLRVEDLRVEDTPREGIGALVDQLARIRRERPAESWALAVPGLVDPDAGMWLRSVNLGARDVPIVRALEDVVDPPAVLANDVSAAAVGEAGGATLALVQLGTGVAGRFVHEGRAVDGTGSLAGEVGHLVVVRDGRRCACGLDGCVEAYAGWGPLRKAASERGLSPGSPADLLDMPEAVDLLDGAFHAVAFAVAVFVAAADPGVVRLGGGVAAALGERLEREVSQRLPHVVLPDAAAATRIELSRLREGAGLVGLARLAREAAVRRP